MLIAQTPRCEAHQFEKSLLAAVHDRFLGHLESVSHRKKSVAGRQLVDPTIALSQFFWIDLTKVDGLESQ